MKKEAKYKEYHILIEDNNSVKILSSEEPLTPVKPKLREIAEEINFDVEESWNTQTLGAKLVDHLQQESVFHYNIDRTIVINRMYAGEYLDDNIGHEIINLFKADNGINYIYLCKNGKYTREELPQYTIQVRTHSTRTLEIISIAELDDKVSLKEITDDIKYGGISVVDIFNCNELQGTDTYVTFKAKRVVKPATQHPVYFTYEGNRPKKENSENELIKDNRFILNEKKSDGKYCFDVNEQLRNYIDVNYDSNSDYTKLNKIIKEAFDAYESKNGLWVAVDEDIYINPSDEEHLVEETPAEIYGIGNLELPYSNAFAFFLKKYPHLLLGFCKYLIDKEKKDIEKLFDYLKSNPDYKIIVKREWKNIDILIEVDKEWIIVVENKIFSDLNGKIGNEITQLNKYHEIIKKHKEYKNRHKLFLLLTPNHNNINIQNYQDWNKLFYSSIANYLKTKPILNDANINAFTTMVIRHSDMDYNLGEMKRRFARAIKVAKTKQKLFTKSAFKTALTCPRQLYYYYDSQTYANQNNDDGFLQALAEGGFQVGELAKIYNDITDETDINSLDYITSLEETKRLFERDEVNIAEAAFRYKNCFVRVDLLKKNGNTLELIEVKAKSWDKESSFTQKKNPNKIASDILPYLYDVAFQKWVVINALKEQYPDTPYTVKAFLMMADKDKTASVNGMNQCFRIGKDENKRIKIERETNAKVLKDYTHILTAFPVDEYCDKIIRGETDEQQEVMGYKFEDFVEKMSDNYCNHKKAECQLGTQCFTCPFQTTPKDSPTLKDGYKECWKEKAKFTDEDFEKPLVKDLWGAYIKRGDFIEEEKYFLKDLSFDDLKAEKIKPTVGLHHIERKLLQIGLATNNEEILKPFQPCIKDGVYIDVEGLQEEMKSWKFPLHMIDFETTAVALPFYKGLRPYEQVAFQFSHHIIHQADNGMGYTIEHVGQYLNTKKGYFPNFDFVRELKMQLEQDNGSVFRYANHENTILRSIHEQLKKSNEPDKEELLSFIDTLTHTVKEVGERDMIDLLEVVKLYFYHPIMKGSNSIKVVLPAVLNSSELLKKKYSQPIYGTEITSKNYTSDSPRTWIAYKENGEVDNPYKRLESISSLLNISEEELSQFGESLDETVCDGGAALAAYSKLQFSDDNISEALETALLRYCELDTLAMVFIWEYFNEMVSLKNTK